MPSPAFIAWAGPPYPPQCVPTVSLWMASLDVVVNLHEGGDHLDGRCSRKGFVSWPFRCRNCSDEAGGAVPPGDLRMIPAEGIFPWPAPPPEVVGHHGVQVHIPRRENLLKLAVDPVAEFADHSLI